MSSKLVTYFSASGVTAKLAGALAEAIGADIFEIQPAQIYTPADLDWTNPDSRSTFEMTHQQMRPEIVRKRDNMDQYDVIFVGFPIWWEIAPTIINTFLESYSFQDKIIVPFATSGGSGMGKVNEKLRPSCPGARLLEGKLLSGNAGLSELSEWVNSLNL